MQNERYYTCYICNIRRAVLNVKNISLCNTSGLFVDETEMMEATDAGGEDEDDDGSDDEALDHAGIIAAAASGQAGANTTIHLKIM